MGTPEFAVPSLQILVQNQYPVVAVVTAPDKPAGRGLQASTSAVKGFALAHGIPVLQPDRLKAPEFLDRLRSCQADLQVVVAFRMLPEAVWAMPPLGTFNLHASRLPQYRGAAPINWVLINGESETGVTTFFLQHEIDTGNIIFQEKEPIYEGDDAGSLYERLRHKGASLVLKTVQAIEHRTYPQVPQRAESNIRLAPKIFKEDCQIHWNQPVRAVQNFVRGLSPYPTAWTLVNGKVCKIYRTRIVVDTAVDDLPAGQFVTDNKTFLHFKAESGRLAVEELQMEGRKRLGIEAFLRGNVLIP
ncbi:MAG: methionyl-tRNA formyltransferase [Ferruginibacter sp.]|nr:methionyl-tRNA formyltransferase [Cytophagales bacterium]